MIIISWWHWARWQKKTGYFLSLIGTVSNTNTLWWGLQYVNLGWSTNQSITHGYSKWPNEHSFNFYSFKKFIHKKRWLEKHVSKMEVCREKYGSIFGIRKFTYGWLEILCKLISLFSLLLLNWYTLFFFYYGNKS